MGIEDINGIRIVPMEQPELPMKYLTEESSGIEYKNPAYEVAIKFLSAGIQKGIAIGKFLQIYQADKQGVIK